VTEVQGREDRGVGQQGKEKTKGGQDRQSRGGGRSQRAGRGNEIEDVKEKSSTLSLVTYSVGTRNL